MSRFVSNEDITRLLNGDRRIAARLITLLEEGNPTAKEAMKKIYPHTGKTIIIGITGGAGAGKSTLIDKLIEHIRLMNKRVGVVVVDPTSPFSGGAFLGDRMRMQRHTMDDGIYIRSMASRGYMGGIARATSDTARVLEAMGMDYVLIETLGTGQDEVDIIHLVQTCLMVVTPSSGDEIQALKAGTMEIGHIFAINKSDLDGSMQFLRGLESALSLKCDDGGSWRPRIVSTVATDGKGIEELVDAILEHQKHIRKTDNIDEVLLQRIEHELGLIFKDELEKIIFSGIKGTGKKKQYIQDIRDGKADPYSVVDDILNTYIKKNVQ